MKVDNLQYWYGQAIQGNFETELPSLTESNKGKKYIEDTLDVLERIAVQQYRENLKYDDVYRMIRGDMSRMELAEVIPQLREVQNVCEEFEIPAEIRHFDVFGIIVNAMVGEYLQNEDKFKVILKDEFSISDFDREKSELIQKTLQDEFSRKLKLKLLDKGINPDTLQEIEDPKIVQQLTQEIENTKQELGLAQIEKHMRSTWKHNAVVWAENTKENDETRFSMSTMDRDNLIDMLATGKCFRHMRVGFDSYTPEVWRARDVFHSKEYDLKYPEKGGFIGRLFLYSPVQFIDKYGYLMSKNDKDKLLKNKIQRRGRDTHSIFSAEENFSNNFGRNELVPFKGYRSYQMVLDMQRATGLPLGEKTMVDESGKEFTIPSFFSEPFNHAGYTYGSILNVARNHTETNFRSDVVQATEVYWATFKKVGFITLPSESGALVTEMVTDELISDYLKENNITELRTISLYELEQEPQPYTIIWDYIKVWYEGVKASYTSPNGQVNLYLKGQELDYQIKGDSNLYDTRPPVTGIITDSLAKKIRPFQIGHNIAMNQIYSFMEKEVGMFFLYDLKYLPSQYKKWGDSDTVLETLLNITRDTGFFPIDGSRQNLGSGGSTFNQFAVHNLSYSTQVRDRMNVAEYFKSKMLEQVGFNPQRLGSPVKYETAEGIKTSQQASYAQTEIYFSHFSDFKRRSWETHLAVAQYAQSNNKDVAVPYTKSGNSLTYLRFVDKDFPLRWLGVQINSSAKDRKELANFKQYLASTNTLSNDALEVVKLFNSDSMVTLIEAAREERLIREKNAEVAHTRNLEAIQAEKKAAEEARQSNWERNEISKQRDRQTKLQAEKIDAMGRAVDRNASVSNLEYVNKASNLEIKRNKLDKDFEIKSKQVKDKREMDEKSIDLQMKKIQNEANKIEAQLQISRDNKYIAEINKN